MFARLLLVLFATHAARLSAGPSLVPQEQLKPTTTATELLNGVVQPRGLHNARQVILVHPTDDIVSVLSFATAGDVLLLANGVYKPEASTAATYHPYSTTGDPLFLASGVYSGLVIDKDITIAAQHTGQAVLDGQGKRRVLWIGNGHVLLKGLKITNGSGGDNGGGIHISGGDLTIRNTQIISNTADVRFGGGGGIYITGGTADIRDSKISANSASSGGGIFVNRGGKLTISNAEISSNTAVGHYGEGQGAGAYIFQGSTAKFSNCSIAGNQADSKGGGIFVEQGAHVQMDDKSAVQSNKPDGCYAQHGFWSSPACNKQ